MAIVVTREPDDLSLSKNPIVYHLQSDARLDNPGAAAVNKVLFSGTIAEGTVVVLRWKGVEQRMVARTTPQLLGFEFPAGVASGAYLASILPFFQDNYYLDADFTVTTASEAGKYWLEFTARQPGTTYNFLVQNTPLVQIEVKTSGIDRKVKPNFCIHAEAWIEKPDGSDFEKIFGESLQVDESGTTQWDLADLLHPHLSPDLHVWEGRQFNKDINSKRRYYIRYAEAWGERFQIGKITKAETKHVLLGGTPYESGANVTIMDVVRESADVTRDKALRLGPDVRYVYPDEPQFLSFLNSREEIRTLVSLKVVAKLAIGGESPVLSIDLGSPLSAFGKATANVGYQQLNLNEIIGGNAVESYTVQLFSGLIPSPISRPYTFVLKYEYKPYRRYFVYLNSLGALDSMHTWGKNSQEIEMVKQSAERYLSPDYKLTDGTFQDWDIKYRQSFEAATGYRHAAEIRQLRDFYISLYKFRKFQNKALPISVISNSLKEYEDGASLIAQSFEYAYNFDDDTWSEQEDTPDQYAPPPGFQGAAGAPIVIKVPPLPGIGTNGNLLFDPQPLQGSFNLINSGNLFKIFNLLQNKLPVGSLDQYIRGNHTIGSFITDALQVINNRLPGFKEEEFPEWIQDETSSGRIGADESIDDTPGGAGARQSGLYQTPVSSKAKGWPVDGKKATLVRVVNGEPGSQTGSDISVTSDGKVYIRTIDNTAGNGDWIEMGLEARHPRFDNIPRLTVTKNVPFTKYVDLAQYISSYHTLSNLSVEIKLNTLKSKGLEIIKDGLSPLLLTLTGKFLEDISIEDDNVLVFVTDDLGNQTTVTLKIGTVQEPTPEEPDTRPACPIGPDYYGDPVVLSNHEVEFGFHGNGVPDIRVKIYVPGVAVPIRGKDNDLISFDNGSALRRIQFEALPPGEYDMSIEGSLCRSLPDIRRIVIPGSTSITWSAGYPKHEVIGSDSTFKLKIEGTSGSYQTQILNMTTGVQVYNEIRDYIAGLNEISIPKVGKWSDANYRINVSTLTATIKVGNPPEPVSTTFKLVKEFNGATIFDLMQGDYEGPVPETGFNAVLQSSNLGFQYRTIAYQIDVKVGSAFITARGNSYTAPALTSAVTNPVRLFVQTGVDSRFVDFMGAPLNRFGEFRLTYTFTSGGSTVQTWQKTLKLHQFNILGVVTNIGPGDGRFQPLIGKVTYDGQNVQNNNVWAEPFASLPKKLEYSIDNGATWYSDVSAAPDNFGEAGSYSNVWILNNGSVDKFPKGSSKKVIFRNPALPTVVSGQVTISNGGSTDPIITIPTKDGVRRTQIGPAKFGVINGKYITAEIRPNGAVKLNYLEQTRSTNGDNDVRAILLDQELIPVPADQVAALRSADGLLLENGDYHFYLYYINHAVASTVDGIFRNFWWLFKDPNSYRSNSFGANYCMVEIRGLKNSNSPNEIKEHADIQSAVWYPQAQLLGYTLDFPAGKDFKITKRVSGLTPAQILTKTTGIEARYDDVNNGIIPYANTYLLGDKASMGAQKGDGHYDFAATIAPFQTIQVEANIDYVHTSDILSDTYKGYRNGEIKGNIAFSAQIIANGKIRYSLTNNGSSEASVSGGFLFVYVFRDTDLIAQAYYAFGARAAAHCTAEFNEGGLPSWAVEEVFKKTFDLQKVNEGITNVSQTNLFGDYFQNNYGMGTNIGILNYRTNKNALRAFMASQTAARFDSHYYITAYLYRHRLVNGYIDGIGRLFNGTGMYSQIFNIELNYIAMADRKVFMWSWLSFEGVNSDVDGATEQRLPIASPEGDLIRQSRGEGSYELGKRHIFIGLLLTQGNMLWHDTSKYSTVIEHWDLAYIGGSEAWKTQWQAKGSSTVVEYDKNNPTHPKFIDNVSGGRWSDTAAPSHNGGYAGAYIYCHIQDMVTDSIRYANFSYTLDGVAHTGYQSGNAPVTGALGNAELSRFGAANPGNHNIIDIWEHTQCGCIVTAGPGGKVAIVWNDNAGLTGKTVYTINEFGGRTITHVGTGIGIYDISDASPDDPDEPEESETEIFHLWMSTTGFGFDQNPASTTGIHPDWIPRIEAMSFLHGRGFGISLMVPWDSFEPTPGVYNTANFQKVIDYCDARELWLSVKFKLNRIEGDGFIHPDEQVKGSLGTVYREGVTGVHASYGCDRTNALAYGAIQQIATMLNTYSRKGYMALAGGHTEELVNHVIGDQGCDFSPDNLARFNTWCSARGLATPGVPPMNHGFGLEWPFPDFNQERGREFGRFMTYNIQKCYTNFVNAVKSVSDIDCIYYYASVSSLQFRCTANAAIAYIGAAGNGAYGTDGDGLYGFDSKIACNSVNLGCFPNGRSGVETDCDDLSTYRYTEPHVGKAPPYGQANQDWNAFVQYARKAYDLGVMDFHLAMAFHPDEIAAGEWAFEAVAETHIGKPYKRPVINSSNLVEVEVTAKYRASQDLLEGIDKYKKYVKYLNNDYWGGVNPPSDNSL